MNLLQKKNIKVNAEMKTISDYALILQYTYGHPKRESIKLAADSAGEELFEKLLERNIDLFTTGELTITD